MSAFEDAIRNLQMHELNPVLIGGMAVVLLGSTRTTRDFDVAVAGDPESRAGGTRALYEAGFRLITRFHSDGTPRRTLDNTRLAIMRVTAPEMTSAFFWHEKSRHRIDLVFDLTVKLSDLLRHGEEIQVGSVRLVRASIEDLIRMKRASLKSDPTRVQDRQDLVYLEYLLAKRR